MDPASNARGAFSGAKFKEVVAALKENNSLASDIQEVMQNNQKVRRDIDNMAAEMRSRNMKMGSEVPLNERKKMQQKQNMVKQLYKAGLSNVSGEIQCIMINQGGTSCLSHKFHPSNMEDEKWQLYPATILGCSFVAVCNSTILSGRNKTASKLLNKDVYGPVILLLLDEEYVPVDMEISVFKKLVKDN